MKRLDRILIRNAAASLLAFIAMPISVAHAYGMTPAVVWIFLGALAVHIGVPVFLLTTGRLRGRRRQALGAYAAVMGVYYVVMWNRESLEMFGLPIFPLLVAILLYFTVGKSPDQP